MTSGVTISRFCPPFSPPLFFESLYLFFDLEQFTFHISEYLEAAVSSLQLLSHKCRPGNNVPMEQNQATKRGVQDLKYTLLAPSDAFCLAGYTENNFSVNTRVRMTRVCIVPPVRESAKRHLLVKPGVVHFHFLVLMERVCGSTYGSK